MATKTLVEVIADHQAGKLEQAESGYRDLLKEDPDNADAIHLLGVICFQREALEEARELVTRAIRINGSVALYHANLGRIEKARGDIIKTIRAYRQSLTLMPDQADVNSDIAAVLIDAGECAEALQFAERALDLLPRFAAAKFNRGMALAGLGRYEAAISAFQATVQLDNGFADAYFQMALIHQESGHLDKAEGGYRNAISIDPSQIEAHCNLGNILRADGRLTEALQCYERALLVLPDVAEIHSNKGVALHELGEREQAIESYRRAIELDADDAEAHRNLSMALLQGDEYEEGWHESEWRWRTRHFVSIRRDWSKPQWSGEALAGKTILVYAEQGFGDSFQFSRYIPLIAGQGGHVIVEAPDTIEGVLRTIDGVEKLISPGAAMPEFDFHIPMMSLPRAFGTTIESIPAPHSYLSAPSEAVQIWRERFGGREEEHRIGIVWKGSSEHSGNLWRSPGLEVFRPLLSQEGHRFFSLQKDDGRKDLKEVGLAEQIIDLETGLNSFSDTAAVIAQLDLVITPDTSVAHLSGAMGCSTWIVLPHVAEWRWGIGRKDCPWYPSARLFRQSSPGDWGGVIRNLADELDKIRESNQAEAETSA